MRRPPSAAGVLRRALLVWGLGHIVVGDRRGWLLLAFQPLAIAATGVLALQLIGGTRWLIVFPVVALLLTVWIAQAVHAHQLALQQGASPGGEMQIVWVLPVMLAVLTAFWLYGGEHGSPAATLQEYVAAWQRGRVEVAANLFADPQPTNQLAAIWREQDDYLRRRVTEAAAEFGPQSGLDPANPFTGLRFEELPELRQPERSTVAVDIVRRQRIETTLLGIIPMATQQTVLLQQAGLIHLRAVPAALPAWWPPGQQPPHVWKIEQVDLPR